MILLYELLSIAICDELYTGSQAVSEIKRQGEISTWQRHHSSKEVQGRVFQDRHDDLPIKYSVIYWTALTWWSSVLRWEGSLRIVFAKLNYDLGLSKGKIWNWLFYT